MTNQLQNDFLSSSYTSPFLQCFDAAGSAASVLQLNLYFCYFGDIWRIRPNLELSSENRPIKRIPKVVYLKSAFVTQTATYLFYFQCTAVPCSRFSSAHCSYPGKPHLYTDTCSFVIQELLFSVAHVVSEKLSRKKFVQSCCGRKMRYTVDCREYVPVDFRTVEHEWFGEHSAAKSSWWVEWWSL